MVHDAVLKKIPASSVLQPGVQIVLDGKYQQFIVPFNKLAKDGRFFVSQGTKTASIRAVVREIAVQPK